SITKDNTYGATFVGFGASAALFGVLCAQTYTYLRRYPLDKIWYKALVLTGASRVLEASHQALIGHAAYYYSISNWGNTSVLLYAPSGECFAMRVWRCTYTAAISKQSLTFHSSQRRQYLWLCKILTPSERIVAASIYTAKGDLQLSSLLLVHQLKVVGSLSLILGVTTDCFTAAALCWFLRSLRTGYKKDDSLVNQLTLYAINTGVLTSVVSLATMILYNLMPGNFIFMGCYFVLSKLYANSFLATLNTRRVSRGRGTDQRRHNAYLPHGWQGDPTPA
ncbi:hypothetical protein BC629DRAFT_1641490, partial [Irpex lacteus]